MARVEIYTKFLCPYCSRAKALLSDKGAEYEEIDITMDARQRAAMIDRSNGRMTVPQIFINNLNAAGKLDPLLAG
jgi:glutaredoxin 3